MAFEIINLLTLTAGFPQQCFPLPQFSLSIYFSSRGNPPHFVPSILQENFHAGFYFGRLRYNGFDHFV